MLSRNRQKTKMISLSHDEVNDQLIMFIQSQNLSTSSGFGQYRS